MERTIVSETSATPSLTYQAAPASDPNQPLTRSDASVLALKILGLYFVIQSVPAMLFVPLSLFGGAARPPSSDWAAITAQAAPFLVIGLVLLLWGEQISRWILPSSFVPVPHRPMLSSAIRLQSIAFSVAGIVLLGWAFPHLARGIGTYFYYARRSPKEHPDLLDVFRPEFIQFFFQAALGAWLFFGSKGLAAYWHRVHGGTTRDQTDDL